jgi:DNA-binding NarL/FixJ family response regulator
MNPQTILIITAGSVAVTLMSILTSIIALGKARRLARAGYVLEGEFENSLSEFSRDLDTLSRKAGEQSRRIAWLETRTRTGRTEQPVIPEMVTGTNPKPNITERRHRVLSLARRGQDVETIARTLGMPHGEVELMINLLKAA